MERKLATIQQISDIQPILGSDFIEQVTVMGWRLVAKRGEFQIGDSCVFCEIDSVLPALPQYSFLEKDNYRIKTKKIRGVLSQGIIFPLSILDSVCYPNQFVLGDDVTALMQITKYAPPETSCALGDTAGKFPEFIPKTDETRIQSCFKVLNEMKGLPYYITMKVDGTSSTFYKKNDHCGVCSRTTERKFDDNMYVDIARRYGIIELLKRFNKNIAIQGEICGPKIQNNRLELKTAELFIFNIFGIDEQRYFNYQELHSFINAANVSSSSTLPLNAVPLIERGESFCYSLEDLLELAKGRYPSSSNHQEGIVVRPQIEIYSQTLRGRLSFKVLNNDFLLKEK